MELLSTIAAVPFRWGPGGAQENVWHQEGQEPLEFGYHNTSHPIPELCVSHMIWCVSASVLSGNSPALAFGSMYAAQLWQQSLLMVWQHFCPYPVRTCLSKTSQVKSKHLSSPPVWGRLCLKRIKKSKFLANVTSYGLAPISFLCSRFLLNGILLSLIVLQPFRFPSALAQIHIFCIVERLHDVKKIWTFGRPA